MIFKVVIFDGDLLKFDWIVMDMVLIIYDEMRDGCYDRDVCIKDFELNWVDGLFLFLMFFCFCGQMFMEGKDKEFGFVCVQVYNNWMIEEWCEFFGGMNIFFCFIFLWDVELVVVEVE